MYADFYDARNMQPLILYFLTALILLVAYFPFQELKNLQLTNQASFNLTAKVSMMREQNDVDLRFEQLLMVLDRNPYSGKWLSDMKQSKLLEQDEGFIEIKTEKIDSSDKSKGYFVLINIFDGQFRDSGHYELRIESNFIRTDLSLSGDQCLFESKSQLIGIYRPNNILFSQKMETLFIEKLKFRVSVQDQQPQFQLLLGAQSEVNIISNKMSQQGRFNNELYLSLFILLQIAIQFIGAYFLIQQLSTSDTLCKTLSPKLIQYAITFDLCQLGGLLFLFCGRSYIAFLTVPIATLAYCIFWFEIRILRIIQPIDGQEEQRASFTKSLTQYSKCLTKGLVTFFLFYLNNMHHFLFLAFFGVFIFPQIYDNFVRGIKITYDLKWLVLFLSPRVMMIVPLRVFTRAFRLEPCYFFTLTCFIFVFSQVSLLYLQKSYGSRSILPKFLTPKGLTEFKFFMIQDENHICSQCHHELKEFPTINNSTILAENKIVVTPCSHKFHLSCLIDWMQASDQCPTCKANLPPIDEDEE